MKILISGKGGCGKSTLSVLIARALKKAGHPVLLIDADESNLCLHRLLGAPAPKNLMRKMGGRTGVREKLPRSKATPSTDRLFGKDITLADLPDGSYTEIDGIQLLVMGKIEEYGEGCACLIGSLSRTLLARLRDADHPFVIIDAEAGVEHFGRRIDAACDLIIGVVDPTHESFTLADRMDRMATAAGVTIRYVLNKVTPDVAAVMAKNINPAKVIARIPLDTAIFSAGLKGAPLAANLSLADDLVTFFESHRPPPRLKFT